MLVTVRTMRCLSLPMHTIGLAMRMHLGPTLTTTAGQGQGLRRVLISTRMPTISRLPTQRLRRSRLHSHSRSHRCLLATLAIFTSLLKKSVGVC